MNWLIYLIVIVLFVFTIYRAWRLVDIYRRRSASQIWTPTTGRVVDKRIRNMSRGMYYPEITYTYTVLGTEYKNRFSMGTSMLTQARSALEGVGDEVSLRYNPQNPKERIADQEKVGAWDIYLVAIGAIVAFIVLFFALSQLKIG